MASLLHDKWFIKFLWPQMEKSMDLFETNTVGDVLFNGWELPYLNFNFSESKIPGLEGIQFEGYLKDIIRQLDEDAEISDVIEGNRVGYFSLVCTTNSYHTLFWYANSYHTFYWHAPLIVIIHCLANAHAPLIVIIHLLVC